jgi:uncharacterized small protein (DUF1192 family)
MENNTELMTIEINRITIDEAVQPREKLNDDVCDEYSKDMMERGVEFPPVEVFFDGEDYILADGFHRLEAAKRSGRDTIKVTVHQGTRREAILRSAGVNATHGLRRTNGDKRKAVSKLLKDEEWAQWSDGVIADKCAVSQPFVSTLRRELTQNVFESERERIGRDGRRIRTADIGKRTQSSLGTSQKSDSEFEVFEDVNEQAPGSEENQISADEHEDDDSQNDAGMEHEQEEDGSEDEEITHDEPVEDLDQSTDHDNDAGSDAEAENVEELKARITELQNEVENKDNRIQELEKQVQELQEENNRLLQELEDQKDTLELE